MTDQELLTYIQSLIVVKDGVDYLPLNEFKFIIASGHIYLLPNTPPDTGLLPNTPPDTGLIRDIIKLPPTLTASDKNI